jgi:hypothetical protein
MGDRGIHVSARAPHDVLRSSREMPVCRHRDKRIGPEKAGTRESQTSNGDYVQRVRTHHSL